MMSITGAVTLSIVSHGHADLLAGLLADVAALPTEVQVIVTLNVPEPRVAVPEALAARIRWRKNAEPRGFAANHNAAFSACATPYFCVVNPDIALPEDPFPALLRCLDESRAALAAPRTLAPDSGEEDSIRYFPTPLGLLLKAVVGRNGAYPTMPGRGAFFPEWVGGMFMLFRSETFKQIGGFDEGFFLYYEDVDICARLWRSGARVVACPRASVIHTARRASRGKNLRHMRWHLASMMRYFWKHYGRLPKVSGDNA